MLKLIKNSINKKSIPIENIDGLNIINNRINSYEKTNESYEANFNFTRNKIYKRIVEGFSENNSEEEDKRKRAESKKVEETLNQLYIIANNNYNGLLGLFIFNNLYSKYSNYYAKIGTATKNIKEMIILSKYNNEIKTFLIQVYLH